MNWRASITLRLSLAFALLAAMVFTALGLYLGRSADAHMAELDEHELFGKLALARHVGTQATTPELLATRMADALVGDHGILLAIDGPRGALFRWPDSPITTALGTEPVDSRAGPVRITVAGYELRMVSGTLQTAWGEDARVVVARDIRHHTDFLDQLRRDFWLAVVAAALLTAAVGVFIARRGMQPVRDIAQAAGKISAGRLAERIPERDVPPELAEMVQAFNAMLARLEESFQRLSDFSADLAHELRTPIHSLRMQAEVSLGQLRTVDEYRELLASNLEDYERLSRIISDMLFLAKADHGLVTPERKPCPLFELCQRLVDYYGILAEDIDLKLDGRQVSVDGDRLMLERAIGNLLINAINHTPAKGTVRIAVDERKNEARITILNTGASIPSEALDRIFDRFVRLDPKSEGNGLGLAIARSIILAHNGDISVRVRNDLTEFSICLPKPGPADSHQLAEASGRE